jgi:hypothetical protein
VSSSAPASQAGSNAPTLSVTRCDRRGQQGSEPGLWPARWRRKAKSSPGLQLGVELVVVEVEAVVVVAQGSGASTGERQQSSPLRYQVKEWRGCLASSPVAQGARFLLFSAEGARGARVVRAAVSGAWRRGSGPGQPGGPAGAPSPKPKRGRPPATEAGRPMAWERPLPRQAKMATDVALSKGQASICTL